MGDILGIRVLAQTWNEDDVPKAWPWLCTLVWPDWTRRQGREPSGFSRVTGLALPAAPGPVERALGPAPHGVVELASAFADMVRIGDLPSGLRKALEDSAAGVEQAAKALAEALGNWETQKALKMTEELEKALHGAEKALEGYVPV